MAVSMPISIPARRWSSRPSAMRWTAPWPIGARRPNKLRRRSGWKTRSTPILNSVHRDDPGRGCALPTLGAEIARESPKTRKAFAAKLDQMIEMLAEQIHGVAAEGRAQAGGGDIGDHDGNNRAGADCRQWRVFRRGFGRRPRGGAGAGGGKEIACEKGAGGPPLARSGNCLRPWSYASGTCAIPAFSPLWRRAEKPSQTP